MRLPKVVFWLSFKNPREICVFSGLNPGEICENPKSVRVSREKTKFREPPGESRRVGSYAETALSSITNGESFRFYVTIHRVLGLP